MFLLNPMITLYSNHGRYTLLLFDNAVRPKRCRCSCYELNKIRDQERVHTHRKYCGKTYVSRVSRVNDHEPDHTEYIKYNLKDHAFYYAECEPSCRALLKLLKAQFIEKPVAKSHEDESDYESARRSYERCRS